MKPKENEFKQLDAMCERIEFARKWPEGTIKGKTRLSYRKHVVGFRNQIIEDAINNRNMPHKTVAEYFGRTVQSIYNSVKEAKEDAEYQKLRAMIEGWLYDIRHKITTE